MEVYQELSYSLLHVNDIEQSEYFRKRYERGTIEAPGSDLIGLSNDILKTVKQNRESAPILTPSISGELGIDFLELEAKINTSRRMGSSVLRDATIGIVNYW